MKRTFVVSVLGLFSVASGACDTSDPSDGVQTVRPTLDDGDAPRDGDIVTVTNTRSRSGWNSAEHTLSPSAVAQSGLTRQWESPVLDSFTGVNPADGTTMTFPPTAWASPLIVKNVAMPGYDKKFGVLIIATGNGFIYAISAPAGNDARHGAPAPGTIL